MKYLFLNNCRGFSNSYIPIYDVNFLVGENSTGKTSVLKLIKLLSSPQFWFNLDFTFQDVEFGHFGDIVSAYSDDRAHFDIGLININKNENNKKVIAFLMTFIEKDGMPFLSVFTYLRDNKIMRLRFTKSQIKYKILELSQNNNEENIKDILSNWLIEHKQDTKGFRVLKLPEKLPFVILTELIEAISEKSKIKNRKNLILPTVKNFFPLVFDSDVAWIAPIRTKPKHTYDMYKSEFSPEGDHTPYLIKKILNQESMAKNFNQFIKKVGLDSGLFENILIKKYGKSATAPFELDVILNKKQFSICSVGYGVSQSLPIIVELFMRRKNTWYAIQQPEVHLHPKAQAALGDLFFQFAFNDGKKFLIETHSDYTIDRFRINYRIDKDANLPMSQILFFERNDNGNSVYSIPIKRDGSLSKNQPSGYREFFIKEEMKVLGLE